MIHNYINMGLFAHVNYLLYLCTRNFHICIMSEKERLIQIMEQEQMNARQFAEEVGIQPGTVSNILNDRNKPSLEVMQKVQKRFPAISPDWLILGDGPMYRQKNDSQQPVLFDMFTADKPISQQPAAQIKSASQENVSSVSSDSALTNVHQQSKRVCKVMIFFDDNTFEELSI